MSFGNWFQKVIGGNVLGLNNSEGGNKYEGDIQQLLKWSREKQLGSIDDAIGRWNTGADNARGRLGEAKDRWTGIYKPYEGFGGRRTQAWEGLLNDPSSIKDNPGYAFRLNQQQEALENSALARGGAFSGNTMKAIAEHGQNYASDEYDRALSREQAGAKFGAAMDTNYADAMSRLNSGESRLDMQQAEALARMEGAKGQANTDYYHGQMGLFDKMYNQRSQNRDRLRGVMYGAFGNAAMGGAGQYGANTGIGAGQNSGGGGGDNWYGGNYGNYFNDQDDEDNKNNYYGGGGYGSYYGG